MIMLFSTQEGAKIHREQVFAAIMAGDRLHTDFKRSPFNFMDADDLRGIEQGVDHGHRFRSNAGMSLRCLRSILAKVTPQAPVMTQPCAASFFAF